MFPLDLLIITGDGPITPSHASRRRRFGLFPGRSPLPGESLLLSLPAGTKMFQFPAFAPTLSVGVGIAPDGLPHSDICGSKGICPSPQLFAAYHVLLRLREPRHPPCALISSVISYGTDKRLFRLRLFFALALVNLDLIIRFSFARCILTLRFFI